ncbi:hypothetical protein AVEN_231518-1 [Araneus ventricosus]|uniref:Uncharacterized protein n=1 Tax=Araneus ventricosus TaxID=182803 RepID=A0A4Y2ID45_ARAVE|nr:hypothetical protein AVEN_231518-1 [Araneus ventricosus]
MRIFLKSTLPPSASQIKVTFDPSSTGPIVSSIRCPLSSIMLTSRGGTAKRKKAEGKKQEPEPILYMHSFQSERIDKSLYTSRMTRTELRKEMGFKSIGMSDSSRTICEWKCDLQELKESKNLNGFLPPDFIIPDAKLLILSGRPDSIHELVMVQEKFLMHSCNQFRKGSIYLQIFLYTLGAGANSKAPDRAFCMKVL